MDRRAEQARLAQTYASALLDLAEEQGLVEAVGGELAGLAGLIAGEPDLRRFLDSPAVSTRDKRDVLVRVFSGRAEPMTVSFLRVLAGHDRLGLIEALPDAWREERDRRARRVRVTVATAVPLDDVQRAAVRGRLAAMLGGEVVLAEQVDGALIGGMTLTVNDELFDGSVRGRLDRLRERMVRRGGHEIQSGRDFLAD